MIGWIACTAVSLILLAIQARLLSRSIDNTSAALQTANEWRSRCDASERKAEWYREHYRMAGGTAVFPGDGDHG